jgi:anti-anti-sigma factor
VELTVRSYLEHVIVAVKGTVDRRSAPVLRERLLRTLNTEPPRLILDLGGLTAMDAGGLDAIAEAHRAARLVGGWLCLANAPQGSWAPDGLLQLVPQYASVEQALLHEPVLRQPPRQDVVVAEGVPASAAG